MTTFSIRSIKSNQKSVSTFGKILEIHTKEIEQYIKLENAHKTFFQFEKK